MYIRARGFKITTFYSAVCDTDDTHFKEAPQRLKCAVIN